MNHERTEASSPPTAFKRDLLLVYEVVLDDVEDADHLREDEHLVVSGLQLRQQLVDEHQLARRLDHRVEGHFRPGAVNVARLVQDLLLRACRGRRESTSADFMTAMHRGNRYAVGLQHTESLQIVLLHYTPGGCTTCVNCIIIIIIIIIK